MNELNIEAERAAFEAWAQDKPEYDFGGEFGGPGKTDWWYWADSTAHAWEGWREATRRAAPADVGEDGLQDESTVYLATTRSGSTCYFGFASWARGWAGEDGTVQEVKLPVRDLQVVGEPAGEDGLRRQIIRDTNDTLREQSATMLAQRKKIQQLEHALRAGFDDLERIHAAVGLEGADVLDAEKVIAAIADLRAQLAARGQGEPAAWIADGQLFASHDCMPFRLLPPLGNPEPLYRATPQPAALQVPPGMLNVLSVMLWLYRRLPRAYGRPPHIEQPILALAKRTGKDVSADLAERDPAPAQGDLQEKL